MTRITLQVALDYIAVLKTKNCYLTGATLAVWKNNRQIRICLWKPIQKGYLDISKISVSGQRRKMGLFNPRSREEQARYVYQENARFQETLRNK